MMSQEHTQLITFEKLVDNLISLDIIKHKHSSRAKHIHKYRKVITATMHTNLFLYK